MSVEDDQPSPKVVEVLRDPAVWAEPDHNLAGRVAEAVTAAARSRPPIRRGQSRWILRGAAAAASIAVIGVVTVAFINQPDWRVDLVPTVEAPVAAAEVFGWNTAAGTRMEITVSGLNQAPSGFYYEIWMTAPDRRHVSAGTFRGSGTVSVWSAVRRAEYPRIWITLEPADGDTTISGETVLDSPS
jgi:hypothetical protein